MSLDVETLALTAAIATLIEVGVLFVLYQLDRSHPGPGWWALGMAALGVGRALNVLRDDPGVASLGSALAFALNVGGFALLYVGILRFLGRRERPAPLAAFLVTGVLAAAFITFAVDSLRAYQVLQSAWFVVLSVLIAAALLGRETRSFTVSARLLAAPFVAFGAFHAVRIPFALAGRLPSQSPLEPSAWPVATQIALLATVLLITFGFVLMVSQRHAVEVGETRDRLDQSRRAEMVARLAGGVAHNFNNLLTVIDGNAEFLAGRIPADDPRRADVDAIRGAASRAATVTAQLLAFGRRREPAVTVMAMDDVVTGLIPVLDSFAGAGVEVAVRPGAPDGRILVDRSQLEEIVMSLAINAQDAMPDGGRMTIETAVVAMAAGDPRLRPPGRPGEYLRLTVADTGGGIPDDVLPRIFEPFFTTKAIGWGPGLGLSSIDGLVAEAGGFVTVDSEVGRGTTFSVHLPRTADTPAA